MRETDSDKLAPAIDEKKLEIFPPGQDATKIIPNANMGCGLKITINIKVRRGRRINWEKAPAMAAFGFVRNWWKSLESIPRATPNMMKPKKKLSKNKLSGENAICIFSRDVEDSKVGCFYKERRNKKTASASRKRFWESITNQSKTTI